MAMFILSDASGIGSDDLDPLQAFVDLVIIANDDGIGMDDPVGGLQRVTYNRTQNGAPQLRLDDLVNTAFTPDYGAGPQNVDTIVIAGLKDFVLDDGSSFADNGTALPPASSGLGGASLNTTENCLVIYDTQQNICVARDGSGGDIDLSISNPVVLYHEFSHAFRIVNNTLLSLGGGCDPASPEENAAIVDENDLRTQIANRIGATPELRDPNIHCGQVGCSGGCCIIASVASRSWSSRQVQALRDVRDHFVRSTEVGFAFFEQFFRDYYSFSPQVCTLMEQSPGVPEALLDGYIHPLLEFWQMMILRSRAPCDTAALGTLFASRHTDIGQARDRLLAIGDIVERWLTQQSDSPATEALMNLLAEHAWPSEYMQWALIEPVRIYRRLLNAHCQGATAAALGEQFAEALDDWAPRFPLVPVWGALSADEVVRELAFCESALMQSRRGRSRFRDRLRKRFTEVTSIVAVLNDGFAPLQESRAPGGAHGHG